MTEVRGSALGQVMAPVRAALIKAATLQACAAIAGIVPLVALAEIGRLLLRSDPVDPQALWFWAALGAVSLVAKLRLGQAALGATHRADVDLQLDLRRRIVARLSRVPLGWFDRQSAGGLKKLLQDDIAALHYMVAHSVPEMTAAVSGPLAILVLLVVLDWRLALIVLIPMVLGLGLYALAFVATKRSLQGYGAHLRKVNEAAVAYVQGIAPIRTFGLGGQAFEQFRRATDDYLEAFARMLRPAAPYMALSDIVFAPVSSVLFVAVAGLAMIGAGSLSLADLLPALFLAPALTGAIAPLSYAQNDMMLATRAAARIAKVLDTPVLRETSQTVPLPPQPDLVFDHVSFGYDAQSTALRTVSAVLRPGTVTALVGPSGSGKSTLARLVPRFWDVDEGAIRLGGHDIRDMPLAQLYQTIGFVFQETELLPLSIAENIALARPDASAAEIETAARAASIHHRIAALPKGYASHVGSEVTLSGGEAQRVAIARAILADAPILVLDEATAFVDPETEADIQSALARLAAGKTVLVIAHRLRSITGADQILVMQAGCLVDSGSHAALLARGGLYRRLWDALKDGEGPT